MVEPLMLCYLEDMIEDFFRLNNANWRRLLGCWLVGQGCLRYRHLSLSTPVNDSLHAACPLRQGQTSPQHNRLRPVSSSQVCVGLLLGRAFAPDNSSHLQQWLPGLASASVL